MVASFVAGVIYHLLLFLFVCLFFLEVHVCEMNENKNKLNLKSIYGY